MAKAINTVNVDVSDLEQILNDLDSLSGTIRGLVRTTRSRPFKPPFHQFKKPKQVPKDQEYFWTEQWQTGEREVDRQLQNGEYRIVDSVEELLADLQSGE